MTLDKHDLWKFHKAINKANHRTLKKKNKLGEKKTKWKIRYYSIGEYGDLGRPHYHSIMFNVHPDTLRKFSNGFIWGKGRIDVGDVNIRSIAYVTKYVIDKNQHHETDPRTKPFSVMSRNPGLGHNYLRNKKAWHKNPSTQHPDEYRYYVQLYGIKQRLPRYYKDKIFTSLDKQILGEISITESDKQYWLLLEQIAKHHDNPPAYYEEWRQHKHDNVKYKSKKQNSLL